MKLISVTEDNLEKEHICCAISNNDDCQVSSKKTWLKERFKDGLVFLKGDVRGKCFIEYIPAEKAWAPVDADGFMYIDCLWVSGQFKGQGNSSLLLDACIKDSKAKNRKGLVILSSKKKQSFLADPKYLEYKGFQIADTADPQYVLYYLPFKGIADKPHFKECIRNPKIKDKGFVLYYAHQCPFTAKYVPIIEKIAKERKVPFKAIRFESVAQAQNAPSPSTSYSLFCNGKFITHEIQSDRKFEKMLKDLGL